MCRCNNESTAITEEQATVIRLAGDSGDGIQTIGSQIALTAVEAQKDVKTIPDFPSEIRAPIGSIYGVSAFQVHFSKEKIYTPGDKLDVLIAFNPAALRKNIDDLSKNGILIVDSDTFTAKFLKKAGYNNDILSADELKKYKLITIPISSLTIDSVKHLNLHYAKAKKCKNFFTLGILYSMYDMTLNVTIKWIKNKFKNEVVQNANLEALKAGYNYAEKLLQESKSPKEDEIIDKAYGIDDNEKSKGNIIKNLVNKLMKRFIKSESKELECKVTDKNKNKAKTKSRVKDDIKAKDAKSKYRQITGNQAISFGVLSAAYQAKTEVFVASYPITPASDIFQELVKYPNFGIISFQAEDEIAAASAAIGASFAGKLAFTCTSGPGMDLKAESIGLAVMAELPLVVVNVQRSGPSTGMPTKTEQSDLLSVLYGRHGEAPVVVMAAHSPNDCYYTVIEAFKIAVKYMIPVILLSDAYIANCSEPWLIPGMEDLDKSNEIEVNYVEENQEKFAPYKRDNNLARNWAIPGTIGNEHRIGGLEKVEPTGAISYEAENHQNMSIMRKEKILSVMNDIPNTKILGKKAGELLVVSWGSTYGAIRAAVELLQNKGEKVSMVHLRYINPLPPDLQEIFENFKKVLVPENNLGQLSEILNANFMKVFYTFNKITGRPFKISEIEKEIVSLLRDGP